MRTSVRRAKIALLRERKVCVPDTTRYHRLSMTAANRDTRAALAYHEATKHSLESLAANRHHLDWDNQPLPFKLYRDLEPTLLPKPEPGHAPAALEAIAAPPGGSRPADGAERRPDLAALSRLLYLSAGITRRRRRPGGEILFRAYPNTGALYHVDLYLVAGELPGLAAGVYHFGPHDFALRRLRQGDYRDVLVAASGQDSAIAHAPLVVASASTYWRNAWKYQARAYRHCFWDAGTLHANLLAVAQAEGLEPRVVLGFADRPVEALLGLDRATEGALTLVPLGRCRNIPPSAPALTELRLETEPLSRSPVDYPQIRAMHAASSLADGSEAASWSGAKLPERPGGAPGSVRPLTPLGEEELPDESLDRLIRRRGSTRAFDPRRSIRLAELSTILDAATRGVPCDFAAPPGQTLLDLYVIAHAVDGLPAGAYSYRREERALELLRQGDFRQTAGRLGLMQALPADAAANVYCLAALDPVLEQLGNRGYRAAQLEGGITGGRMYLAAYALGLGATGLTFLDDEVTEFFSPRAAGQSVMFLVAIGHSDRDGLRIRA